jgi:hypothetical protein
MVVGRRGMSQVGGQKLSARFWHTQSAGYRPVGPADRRHLYTALSGDLSPQFPLPPKFHHRFSVERWFGMIWDDFGPSMFGYRSGRIAGEIAKSDYQIMKLTGCSAPTRPVRLARLGEPPVRHAKP